MRNNERRKKHQKMCRLLLNDKTGTGMHFFQDKIRQSQPRQSVGEIVTKIEAKGKVHCFLQKVVIIFGVKTQRKTTVVTILKCQFGCGHTTFGDMKIGAVPTHTLKKIASPRCNILMAVPIACLNQHPPTSAPEGLRLVGRTNDILGKLPVERELRPYSPAATVWQAFGR